jgi:hypothetical protein
VWEIELDDELGDERQGRCRGECDRVRSSSHR